jgi:hypothetical protein
VAETGEVTSDANLAADLTSFLAFEFTDEQWTKLVKLSDALPHDARADFQDIARSYLFARARKLLHEVEHRDARERLRKKILSVLEDSEWPIATAWLVGGWGTSLNARSIIEPWLKLLAKKLELQNSRVAPDASRPGPKSSQVAYQFVAGAATLFEKHTGKPVTRSRKRGRFADFITELSAIVDSNIGPGTIDEALKEYIHDAPSRCRGEDRP